MNEKELLKKVFRDRKDQYFRKYDFGLVLIIGGGEFYSGSPALSAMAALKTGADMVKITSPKRAADIIASFSPNLSAYPLDGNWLEEKHVPTLLAHTVSAESVSRGNMAVVIGGGAGRSEETKTAIRSYLAQINVPAVIDAAAIYALGDDAEIIKDKGFLLTPHAHEFFILTGKEVHELEHKEKQKVAKQEAKRLGATILLKTGPDIITDGEEIALSSTGSPYMSVGGTGDALAGICGALIARGLSAFDAGFLGSYIVGRAGQLAAEDLRESLLATDVINAIPQVIKEAY